MVVTGGLSAGDSSKANASSSGNNLWAPYKELSTLVEDAIVRRKPGTRPELEEALRRHKPAFIALLKNPARNASDAEILKKAQGDGIRLPGMSSSQTLSPQIVEEALIVSELFGLNEISSLQLLLQGEEQLCQYPGLTRGLVAVLLYYDGRKSLVQSLRSLIQSRAGITWTLDTPEEITDLTTTFTQQLLEDGLVDRILVLLHDMDWQREAMNLQKHMALGDAKHRKLVQDLFEEIRQSLADCLFCFAAQSGLPKNDTLRLLDHLSKVKKTEGTATGALDNVTLTLTMTALYTIDISAMNKCEDGEEAVHSLPIVRDDSFVPAIHRDLSNQSSKRWEHPTILSVMQFAWSITLAAFRALPHHKTAPNFVDDDETVLDMALDNRVFHLLPEGIIANDQFPKEEFYVRRVHQLITDLIVLMPLKVKELRNRADDAARNKMMHEQEGIQYTMPLAGQHFEHVLNTIAALYRTDMLGLGLMLEYWCPADGGATTDRLPQRQVSLYKFVRLAGDLLMPSLYTPYVNMLVSLSGHAQAALHCFNLLKLNGSGGHGSSTVSWDHFFSSLHQYFSNLRHEAPAAVDTIYHRARLPMTRGISPAEVEGLVCVLRLTEAVCRNCEPARVAIAESTSWQPAMILMGLIGCPVPTHLKAELIKTLSALALSADVTHSLWQAIEASQLIQTVPSPTMQKHGLITELEEIESRSEEYALTRSFLKLMDVLTDNEIPATLGTGTRVPGFEPYLKFIRDVIFLRFNTKAYKNPEEKWQVAELSLKLICKLLSEYEPSIQDFQTDATATKHPGFQIIVHLLQSSETLRMLLYILDEGCNLLDTYQPFSGKVALEQCCLYSLRLLETALTIQTSFLEVARSSNSSLLLTPLDKLLLGINPRTGHQDHMLNVTKFVTYGWWLPSHTLSAVRILQAVAASPSAHAPLLATFTTTSIVAQTIIKGFTEVLELEEDEQDDQSIGSARIAIVELLQSGLEVPAPSLSHFLLGFDLQKGVSRTTLQSPGVLGAVRSPLHAILGILTPPDLRTPSPALFRSPHFCEASFKLIYSLACNHQTSEPVLRYLRSSEDFLSAQLALLPLSVDDQDPSTGVPTARAVAWLLKTVAIELKIVSSARLRSQVAHLTGLLLDTEPTTTGDDTETWGTEAATLSQLSRTVGQTTRSVHTQYQTSQHRLLAILNSIDFAEESLSAPHWEVFDDGQVNQVLRNCNVRGKSGERLVDVQALHKILNLELANLQGATGLNQRQMIQQEIQNILVYAVRWNSVQEKASTRRDMLDAWRQVTEVMLCSTPLEILPSNSRQQLLLELLQTLLNKVLDESTMPELANQVSGVVLLLLAALRQTYSATVDSATVMGDSYVPILDSTPAPSRPKVYSAALQVILKGLIQWIIGSSTLSQRVRVNLYGALLNYLRIGKGDPADGQSDRGKLQKANLEVLAGYGDSFLEIVCRDCVSGHDIRRMLALSVIDELISLDGRGSWVWFLSNQGYLRHLIESLPAEDDQLIQMVSPQPDNLRALYTYESKMAMLTRLASTIVGAELLLESGLMLRLSELQVFSARPEAVADGMDVDSFIPSTLQRYHQILFPALRVCEAVLASLGSENRSASAQVLHFLTANEDLVRSVLRSRSQHLTLPNLRELSLLTGIVSRCIHFDLTATPGDIELSGHLNRLQRQMLALIPQFSLSEGLMQYVKTKLPAEDQPEAVKCILEVTANTLMYARNVVSRSSTNAKYCRIIFGPSLLDAQTKDSIYDDRASHVSTIPNRPPTLGQVVLTLKNLSTHLISCHVALSDLQEKLNGIHQLTSQELSSFLPSGVSDRLSSADRRSLATNKIRSAVADKEHAVRLTGSAIENATLLIWRHLEHFLLYSARTSEMTPYQKAVRRLNDEPTLPGDDSRVVSSYTTLAPEELSKLKEEATTVFSDTLFLKLQDVEQLYSKQNSSVGFLEAMIRRLKRLASLHT